jgi:acetamidase/formamidase
VTITQLSLNRSTAFTTESFSSRSVDESIAKQFKKAKLVKWKLDTFTGYASLIDDTLYEHLHDFKAPVKPFLGCIGVAPSNKKNEILSFFQGSFGGNMDCPFIRPSATVYLPVFHKGAYLYVGDGHALQGDGEIAGNALETSLNISFTVKIIKKDSLQISFPRIENDEYIMTVGTAKNLDDALKIATTGLLNWLQQDYRLTLQEATQVMSTTIEYNIPEISDPEVEVIAKIKKDLLKPLLKY